MFRAGGSVFRDLARSVGIAFELLIGRPSDRIPLPRGGLRLSLDLLAFYVTDEGDTSAREAYVWNCDRLAVLKNKYDPTNFLRMNRNIKPITAAQATT